MFPAEGTATDLLPAAPASARTLRLLLDLARGKQRPLIHLQHNPDPDAIASALAMQHLLRRLLHVEAVLAYTGLVGRAENRALLRWLKIQIVPSYKIDYAEHDFIVVVDTHPGTGTCRLPPGIVPNVVIDHHPRGPSSGVALTLLDPASGSTCTMVGALILDNGIELDERVATALAYGIRTDTLDLARGGGPKDEAVFEKVFALADKRLLGKIERARVTQEYFQILENGLRRAQITDHSVTTWVGPISYRRRGRDRRPALPPRGHQVGPGGGRERGHPLLLDPRHRGRGRGCRGRGPRHRPGSRRRSRDLRRGAVPAAQGHGPAGLLRGPQGPLLEGHARQAHLDPAAHPAARGVHRRVAGLNPGAAAAPAPAAWQP
jgi:hypothetical protein